MKRTITLVFMILLVALSVKLKAQQPQMQPQQQQQQLLDTIRYWMEYNYDYLEANDYDSIWSVRCFIQIPAGVAMNNFHLTMKDLRNNSNIVDNFDSPAKDSIITGFINAVVDSTPHAKRSETGFQPSYLQSNNTIVVDLGFHRNRLFDVEIIPKDNMNQSITKIKKLNEIKY